MKITNKTSKKGASSKNRATVASAIENTAGTVEIEAPQTVPDSALLKARIAGDDGVGFDEFVKAHVGFVNSGNLPRALEEATSLLLRLAQDGNNFADTMNNKTSRNYAATMSALAVCALCVYQLERDAKAWAVANINYYRRALNEMECYGLLQLCDEVEEAVTINDA